MNTQSPSSGWMFCLTAGLTVASLGCLFTPAVQAQPITPATDGTGTVINPDGNQYNIDEGSLSGDGQNLFHSFEKFGLSEGQVANFLSNPDIINILGRVVGGDVSVINGKIQVTGGNSNLFLINPAGVIFGSNASLNIPADFTVTTATAIEFGNNLFNVIGNPDYTSLIGNPSGYLFNVATPGSIINEGNLTVEAGQNLTLLGGTIVNTGELSAVGGNITIAAVTGENLVRISQAGQLLNLEVSPLNENTGEPLSFDPLSLPELLTNAETGNATTVTVNDEGQVELTGSNLQIEPDNGTVIASGNLDATGIDSSSGSINILGDRVTLINSEIAANGDILFQATDEITLDDGLSLTFPEGEGEIIFDADTDNQGNGIFRMDGTQSITTSGRDLTILADDIDLGNLTTDGGDLFLEGTMNLTHDVELSTGIETGDITLNRTVNGNQSLTLEAGEGAININEPIGGTIPLSSLEINTASQTNLSEGNITTNTGVIFNQTPVNLESDITINTNTENGNIQFNQSPINGTEHTLTLNAGTGNLDLDAVGSEGDRLGGLLIESAENVNLSGDIYTNGGLDFTNVTQVNLINDVTLNTAIDNGNINFTGIPIEGPGGLSMNVREGQVNLETVGETTPLAAFEVDGFGDAETRLNGNITTDGEEISLGTSVVLTQENITLSTGEEFEGNISIFRPVNSDSIEPANLTLIAGQGNVDVSFGNGEDSNSLNDLNIQGNRVNLGNIEVQNNLDVNAQEIISTFSTVKVGNDLTLEAQNSIEISIGSSREINVGNNTNITTFGNLTVINSSLISENSLKLEIQGNINIQESQISANSNIDIISEDTIEIRDSLDNNFTIQANGEPENSNLLIQGSQGINIFTENNSSQIQSGGNISLLSNGIVAISNETVTLDSGGNLFDAGGSFSILNLDGEPGNFSSNFQDTLIYAEGDITFGDYTGLALKIETKGSITGGDITIIGGNDSLAETNPDDADFEILSNSPALILRAGVTELTNEQNTPSEAVGGVKFTVSETPSSLGSITVGNINTAVISSDSFSEERGPVILEATGDITAQNITTASSDIDYAPEGRVTISSLNGDIEVENIRTGGGILEITGNSITAQDINTFGGGRDSNDPNHSSVTLIADEGNIIVNTIQAGGNINIETPALFQALGFVEFGGVVMPEFELQDGLFTSSIPLKDRPEVIDYLASLTDEQGNPYFTRDELENSEATVAINTDQVFPASIISLPSNVNVANPVQIKIKHGGQSINDSDSNNSLIVISGNGETFDFVVGPHVTTIEGEEFVLDNDFGSINLSEFDLSDPPYSIALRRNETTRPLIVPQEFPANVSGTVGAIAIGNDRDNAAMYSSLRDIPLISPPIEPPVEPPVDPPEVVVNPPVNPPVEPPVDPPEVVVNPPVNPPVEPPVDPPEVVVNPPVNPPVDPPVDTPVDTPVDSPVEPPVDPPEVVVNPPVNPPVDPPEVVVDPPVNTPVEPPDVTPDIMPTPDVTPDITPTPDVTPNITPTPDPIPAPTPTPIPTPSVRDLPLDPTANVPGTIEQPVDSSVDSTPNNPSLGTPMPTPEPSVSDTNSTASTETITTPSQPSSVNSEPVIETAPVQTNIDAVENSSTNIIETNNAAINPVDNRVDVNNSNLNNNSIEINNISVDTVETINSPQSDSIAVNNSIIEIASESSSSVTAESDLVAISPEVKLTETEITRSVLEPVAEQSVIPDRLIQAACSCYRSGAANNNKDCQDLQQFLRQQNLSQPIEITLKACGSGVLNFIIYPSNYPDNQMEILPELLTGGNRGNVTEIEIDENGQIQLK